MSSLGGLTPTEHLVMEVLAARYRLGEECWTFPFETGPALDQLAEYGYLLERAYLTDKSGGIAYTRVAWLTDAGKAILRLDKPYMRDGEQVGRAWEPPGPGEAER